MHTEKLENLRPSWIAFGWFIAAAVTALLILAFVAFGLIAPDSTRNEGLLTAMALLIGFLVGGFFVGFRTRAAPILHGVGIGLFSLVVWFLANLIPGEATGWTAWRVLPTIQALALVALQTVAAIVGARMAVRMGRP